MPRYTSITRGSWATSCGLALRDHLAVVEHHAAVHDPHQHAHDVLDPDDGDAALRADAREQVGDLLHLRLVEAAERFVGEQQLRLRRERARQLQLLQRGRAEAVDARARIGRAGRPARALRAPASNAFSREGRFAPDRSRRQAPRSRAATGAGTDAGSDACGRCRSARRDRPDGRRSRARGSGSIPRWERAPRR